MRTAAVGRASRVVAAALVAVDLNRPHRHRLAKVDRHPADATAAVVVLPGVPAAAAILDSPNVVAAVVAVVLVAGTAEILQRRCFREERHCFRARKPAFP